MYRSLITLKFGITIILGVSTTLLIFTLIKTKTICNELLKQNGINNVDGYYHQIALWSSYSLWCAISIAIFLVTVYLIYNRQRYGKLKVLGRI